jgi:hypothetical protein
MAFDVKRQNFENMIHSNSTKLRLIQRGWDPNQVLTLPERKRLFKEGILKNGNGYDDVLLSDEAMVLLNDIYKNPL